MYHSPVLREDFKIACEKAGIKPLQMKCAIATHWNSLADAIMHALKVCHSLEGLLTLAKYDKLGPQSLRRCKVTRQEWEILEQLEPLLSVSRYTSLVLSLLKQYP